MLRILFGMKACLAVVMCLFVGCAPVLQRMGSEPRTRTFERRCRPVQTLPRGLLPYGTTPGPPLSAAETEHLSLATGFTPQSLQVAGTIGALRLLTQLPDLERAAAQQTEGAKERLRDVRLELSDRILLALLQVTSISAEIVCEAERADQLADRLEEKEVSQSRTLTILAILATGVAGIAGGAVAIANQAATEGIFAVVGGALATAFSGLALKEDLHSHFKHPRNLLRDVWEGPTSSGLFPEVVWRFLNRPLEEDPTSTLRLAIIERWRNDGRLGPPSSALEQRRTGLVFGDGGDYEVEDLRARAQMLDMLESQVSLMNQYLERLLEEVLARGSLVQ